MKKLLWSLLGLFGISSSVAAADNAGIYLSRTFDDSKIEFSSITGDAEVKKEPNEEGYRLEVIWPDVTVLINVRESWADKDIQLNGMSNWVNSFGVKTEKINDLYSKIQNTQDLVGCVIKPSYDKNGKVVKLLQAIAQSHDGYIFTYQSFYDEKGNKIVGLPNDPYKIQ